MKSSAVVTALVLVSALSTTSISGADRDPERTVSASCEDCLSKAEAELDLERKARHADQEALKDKVREQYYQAQENQLLEELRQLKLKHEEEEKKRVDLELQLEEAGKREGCVDELNEWKEKVRLAEENCQRSLTEKDTQYRDEIAKLTAELEIVKETNTRDITTKDEKISELEREISELKSKLQSGEENQQKTLSLQNDIEQLKQQASSERERAETAESNLRHLEEQADTLRQEVTSSEKKSQESEKQLSSSQQDLVAEQQKVSEFKSQLDKTTKELNELKESGSQSGEEIESLQKQLETLQEERDNLEDESELLKSRTEVQVSEIEDLKSKFQEANANATQMSEERESLLEEQMQLKVRFGIAIGVVAILLVHEVFLFCRTGGKKTKSGDRTKTADKQGKKKA